MMRTFDEWAEWLKKEMEIRGWSLSHKGDKRELTHEQFEALLGLDIEAQDFEQKAKGILGVKDERET